MTKILHLTLKRESFAAIVAKKKRIEYREQKPYWRKRLEGRKYDVIKFRNGYSPNSPEMLVEFRGFGCHGKGRNAYYAIRLGRQQTRAQNREGRRAAMKASASPDLSDLKSVL